MTTLEFPGQVHVTDPLDVRPGGCAMGNGRCIGAAEVEVEIPDLRLTRRLCREHVGSFMLAGVGTQTAAAVLVRRVA